MHEYDDWGPTDGHRPWRSTFLYWPRKCFHCHHRVWGHGAVGELDPWFGFPNLYAHEACHTMERLGGT